MPGSKRFSRRELLSMGVAVGAVAVTPACGGGRGDGAAVPTEDVLRVTANTAAQADQLAASAAGRG